MKHEDAHVDAFLAFSLRALLGRVCLVYTNLGIYFK